MSVNARWTSLPSHNSQERHKNHIFTAERVNHLKTMFTREEKTRSTTKSPALRRCLPPSVAVSRSARKSSVYRAGSKDLRPQGRQGHQRSHRTCQHDSQVQLWSNMEQAYVRLSEGQGIDPTAWVHLNSKGSKRSVPRTVDNQLQAATSKSFSIR